MHQAEISLATILHDPEDRQYRVALPYLKKLTEIYAQVFIASSNSVSEQFLEELEMLGMVVQQTEEKVGGSRRLCVEMAVNNGAQNIHYCDFDRSVHWIRNYPQEIARMSEGLQEADFLITGRTDRAFDTHPKVQQLMENITNTGFSLYYGRKADVTAGSCAMNYRAAEMILQSSIADDNSTDTEWPSLAYEQGLTVREDKFEGLEFETADYYQEEIAVAGGVLAWMNNLDKQLPQWENRAILANNSLQKLPYAHR